VDYVRIGDDPDKLPAPCYGACSTFSTADLLSSSSVHDGVIRSAILLINVVGQPMRRPWRVVSRSMSDDAAAAVVEGGSSALLSGYYDDETDRASVAITGLRSFDVLSHSISSSKAAAAEMRFECRPSI